MIYISTSSVKTDSIKEAVEILYNNGFTNIELSGGTKYYSNIKKDLIDLKNKYNLNFICHNYFPPPVEDFVINLASTNKKIFNLSMENIRRSLPNRPFGHSRKSRGPERP